MFGVHYMNSNGVSSLFSVYDDWIDGICYKLMSFWEVLLLSIFGRVDEWWILCTKSHTEEILYISYLYVLFYVDHPSILFTLYL